MTRDPAYPPQEDQRTMRSGEGQQDGSDVDDSDIYRGTPPAPSLNHASSLDSLVSSSSSESFFGRGRLGVLAAVVELAITRWARRNSLSSSSSSDSSSVTLSRSQRARLRKCRSSVATLQTVQSERDFAARINRIKAREDSRQTPREFALYLPPSLSVEQPRDQPDTGKGEQAMRIIWTASLPLVLSQLDTALKRAAKARRSQLRTRIPRKFLKAVSTPHRDYMLPGDVSTQLAPPHTDSIPGGKAGKHKDTPASASPEQTTRKFPTKKAWFLDVASPTWEDMRAIGKLLHLHPLTLEDILQRDPREKLELFPKLGYYFISFRAIEGRDARAKRTTRGEGEENDEFSSTIQDGGDDGVIGEGNVYLVVFNEGICTFHFTDISEHTDRIRNRILLLEEVLSMSSDWIAHGILDSIVDSFFPVLDEIEKEVVAIDNLVFARSPGQFTTTVEECWPLESIDKTSIFQEVESFEMKENPGNGANYYAGTPLSAPKFTIGLGFRRLKLSLENHRWRDSPSSAVRDAQPSTTHTTLRRMARTRKLVTSLARLLAAKSEVVSQIRKRLLTSSLAGLGNGTSKHDDIEVAIYMGDVQDHILTLQHSLAHYERMLSQSHPTYLSQLRTAVALTKSGTDKAIIFLTVVGVAVLCVQTLVGTLSLNVTVPQNDRSPDSPYHVFGIVIALASLILCGYMTVVRQWWIQAKRRRGAVL